MFIEPASNVSVPFTVVTRILSNVPDKVRDPEPIAEYTASDKLTITSPIQTLLSSVATVILPCLTAVAVAAPPNLIKNPELYAVEPGLALPTKVIAEPKYPDVT